MERLDGETLRARLQGTAARPTLIRTIDKRSVVFIWHVGEEAGLLGSRYNADFPVVPLEKVQAVLNMDMVGRDDCVYRATPLSITMSLDVWARMMANRLPS
jgi:Zn-dependent M28 family amino/carboxypeptidase